MKHGRTVTVGKRKRRRLAREVERNLRRGRRGLWVIPRNVERPDIVVVQSSGIVVEPDVLRMDANSITVRVR